MDRRFFDMEITCLVPAFKVKYFEHLIFCLNTQKIKPKSVLISDDTANGDFLLAVKSEHIRQLAQGLPIEVVRGPKQGNHKNIESLLRLYLQNPTSHFHILNDDDIIYPDFYFQHAATAEKSNPLCSVSRRWIANDFGIPVACAPLPDEISSANGTGINVSPALLAESFLIQEENWIGELSVAVFRSDFLGKPEEFCLHQQVPYFGLNDIGSFLKASLKESLVFINQYLGAFRISSDGISNSKGYPFSLFLLAKISIAMIAYENNLIDIKALNKTIQNVQLIWGKLYGHNPVSNKLSEMILLCLQKEYGQLKSQYLNFYLWYLNKTPELKKCKRFDELSSALSRARIH